LAAPPSAPFAVYVWEVLSVGTTPARRDAAFAALKQIPALTADAIARVPQARLEAAVALGGPMKDERLRALRAGADLFRRDPSLLDDLADRGTRALRATRRIPHLGRASSLRLVLYSGAGRVLPLDEHALRVALRLGYAAGSTDRPLARVLSRVRQAIVHESGREITTLRTLSQYLTHHGLSTCTESMPHCTVCPVTHDCEWIRRQ
jgi:endonuclease III